jgi:hypothetical protein
MIEAMGLKIIASRSPHETYQVSIEKLLVEVRHRQIGDLITLVIYAFDLITLHGIKV